MENEIQTQDVTAESGGGLRVEVPFKKSVVHDGREYFKIDLNFEALTGNDAINAEREARIMGDRTAVLEASKYYQAVIAAKASKLPVELIMALPMKEFSAVTMAVQNFLLE